MKLYLNHFRIGQVGKKQREYTYAVNMNWHVHKILQYLFRMEKIIFLNLFIILFFGCNSSNNNEHSSSKGLDSTKVKLYLKNAMPIPPKYSLESFVDTIPIKSYTRKIDSLELISLSITDENKIWLLKHEIEDAKIRMDLILESEATCNIIDDSKEVELYDGSLGVSRATVVELMNAIAQIQWNKDFGSEFDLGQNSRGNVEGVRWCTGCLFNDSLFLTAGHCFSRDSQWELPKRNGRILSSEEMAQMMHINFEYQTDSLTGKLRNESVFPITELLENKLGGLDYAILQLGRNENNQLPGDLYRSIPISRANTAKNDSIVIIQHPNGDPKKIEAGELVDITDNKLFYDDIDTQKGSSGSPIINIKNKEIIGVHTNGGCDRSSFKFRNSGYSIESIRRKSRIIN